MTWFMSAFISMFLYGIWGFLSKIATHSINSVSVMLFQMLGGMVVTLLIVGLSNFKIEYEWRGSSLGFLVGVVGMLATLFFIHAISQGSASVVSIVTALYPLFTIGLALLFLKESLTLPQGVGAVLGVVAIALFTID
ncbi:MAG: DMT family transporter [Leptolyngbya sp. SIO3F4]|nr:DMT family transporter [Leptolyngbya sp. SIO3F4]